MIVRIDGSSLRHAVEQSVGTADPSAAPISSLDDSTARPLRENLQSQHSTTFDQFRASRLPVLIFENAFQVSVGCPTPDHILPDRNRCWWPAAHAALAAMDVLDLKIVSFECENSGCPFINVTPLSGAVSTDPNDVNKSLCAKMVEKMIEKSGGDQCGHTDAVNFPFPGEFASAQRTGKRVPSPAPDFVVLLGIRNPSNVPTYVSPLSEILRQLSAADAAALSEPHYVISGQTTFATDHIAYDVPILTEDPERGTLIRFSHSNVQTDPAELRAEKAYEALCNAQHAVRQPLVICAGDIAFINNRITLHGRGKVGARTGASDRWLIRAYANFGSTGVRYVKGTSFMLEC